MRLNYSEMAYALAGRKIVKSKLHRSRQALKEKIMATGTYLEPMGLVYLIFLINIGIVRCHKSYLVNTRFIKGIEKWGDRAYQISFFKTDKKALLSRSHAKNINKLTRLEK